MCLSINQQVKPSRVNKDGYCVGYKLVEIDDDGDCFSYFKYFPYRVGDYVSNRMNENKLELDERDEVHLGFHLFTTRNEARRFSSTRVSNVIKKIIRVFYKPEDVVAYGKFGYNRKYRCVVVHKMSIRSLNAIR